MHSYTSRSCLIALTWWFLVSITLGLTGCAGRQSGLPHRSVDRASTTVAGLPDTNPATLALLDQIIANPNRTESIRARDRYLHPRETFQFFGIRADMTVLDVWPQADGWSTQLLAPLLREKGHYYIASYDPESSLPLAQGQLSELRQKLAGSPALYDKATLTALDVPGATHPVSAGSADMVVSFLNLNTWLAHDRALPMLGAMYDSLKPGGILGLVDHRANKDALPDPKAKMGYVAESLAISLAQQAGFELQGSSEINANPADTHDYELGVFVLPPTYRLGEKDRARYSTIGESDRFTLVFRKPKKP